MNNVTAEEIAKKAAHEAVKEYIHTQHKIMHKKNFRNTKKLMENYKAIKACVDDGISEITDTNLEVSQDLGEDEIFIASIRRSRLRSAIMIANIEKALENLEKQQEQHEKLDIFRKIYFEGKSYAEVSEIYNCSEITARRWANEMIERLSIYIFGIDGLS